MATPQEHTNDISPHHDAFPTNLGHGTTQGLVRKISLDVWFCIGDAVAAMSHKDFVSLCCVNKTLWSLFTYKRAFLEAYSWCKLPHRRSYPPHRRRTCLNWLILRNEPLEIIEPVIRGYCAGGPKYLNGLAGCKRFPPALFFAAQMNRLDVMDILLSSNKTTVNVKYKNKHGCRYFSHKSCRKDRQKNFSCTNALCAARVAGSEEAVDYLLEKGIEDRCNHYCWWRHKENIIGEAEPYYSMDEPWKG
ncbi:hypothetical protein F5Y04DRAFT_141730 [Hypomontagnella monticulosa]|nr:hypothetical protein F5Y04DRAFT_141730 [Hypomontagnella monticulosa]